MYLGNLPLGKSLELRQCLVIQQFAPTTTHVPTMLSSSAPFTAAAAPHDPRVHPVGSAWPVMPVRQADADDADDASHHGSRPARKAAPPGERLRVPWTAAPAKRLHMASVGTGELGMSLYSA